MRSRRQKVACLAAGWLLASAGAAGGAEGVDTRIERLLSEVRSAGTLAEAEQRLRRAEKLLEIRGAKIDSTTRRFLQADIRRARGRWAAMAWRRRPTGNDALRETARKELGAAIGEYTGLVQLCEDRLDAMESRLGPGDPSRNRSWRTLRGQISRANYCEAWSHYNLGLIAADEARRKGRFDQAVERFSSFTARGYRNHPIVADCFLGQALCHYERKQYFQVLELLKPARASNTPADIFKRMAYLLIKSAEAYGSYLAAENCAKRYFDALPASHKLDAIELGMALERAKCLGVLADPKQNPEYHKLFRGRLDAVAKAIYARGEPWRTELARVLGRNSGATPFKCLSQAQTLFKSGKFAEAAAKAGEGIAAATAETPPAVLADLRYVRAAAAVNRGKPLEAFRAAGEFLRNHPADRRAGGLCRAALRAGREALQAKPPLPRDDFLGFLAWMEKRLPTHPEAKRIPWYRARVFLDAGRLREAERALGAVPADSPVYVLAQYGLAVAAAKQAEALARRGKADPKEMARLVDGSARAVERFVASAGRRKMSDVELQAARTVVDVAVATARRYLELPAPRPARAVAVLDRADKLAAYRGRAGRQRLALRCRAHLLAGDMAAAERAFSGLLRSPVAADGNAPPVLASLLGPLMDPFDRLTKAGKTEAAAGLGGRMARMQERVLRSVSASPTPAVRAQEGAARWLLAEILRKVGRHAEAAGQYEQLLPNTPKRKAGPVLRGLAICQEKSRRYASACERWQALAGGLKKKTDGWYEARYHWFWCLYQQGRRDDARKRLAYFRLQHPRIATGIWQAAFDALGQEMHLPPSSSRPGGETK